MTLSPRSAVRMTLVLALAVFCGVQDRVTAAGARRYVSLQRAARSSDAPAVSIDSVMRPAVARSVQQGLLWAGLTAAVGLGAAFMSMRRVR
jgi:hypothetical protein